MAENSLSTRVRWTFFRCNSIFFQTHSIETVVEALNEKSIIGKNRPRRLLFVINDHRVTRLIARRSIEEFSPEHSQSRRRGALP
jgi:hypothetical protein